MQTHIYMCARDKNTKKLIKKMYEANLISHHPSRKHDILRALIKIDIEMTFIKVWIRLSRQA